MQLLISGDHRLIDIVDMKKHANYGSGYHESQSYIEGFWTIVSEMTPQGNVWCMMMYDVWWWWW